MCQVKNKYGCKGFNFLNISSQVYLHQVYTFQWIIYWEKILNKPPIYLSFSIKLEHFDQLKSMGKGSISLPGESSGRFLFPAFPSSCLKKKEPTSLDGFLNRVIWGPETQPQIESPAPCFPLIVIDSLCRWPFCKCRCWVDIGVSYL